MHGRFAQRIEEGLQSLGRRISKAKRTLDRGVLERQIGRLVGRNSRAAGRYAISISEDHTAPARMKLAWSTRPEWDEWAAVSEGTYILRTNVHDWSDEELWQTYIQLTEAEAAFRIQKSDLCIRPIWHQKAERIKAHILVCFLAYALWKTLQQWQSRAGLGDAPRTILTELATYSRRRIALPLASASRKQLRCAAWAPGSRAGDPAAAPRTDVARATSPATDRRNVVPTRNLKALIYRDSHLRTVEVGLTRS